MRVAAQIARFGTADRAVARPSRALAVCAALAIIATVTAASLTAWHWHSGIRARLAEDVAKADALSVNAPEPRQVALSQVAGDIAAVENIVCVGAVIGALAIGLVAWVLLRQKALHATVAGASRQAQMPDVGDALRESEARLRASEEHLERAQHVARIGSWEFDLARNQYTWSKEMYRIRGVPPDFVPSLVNLRPLNHEDDYARAAEWLRQLRAGVDRGPVELRIRRPDGTVRTVSAEAQVVKTRDGKVEKIVGTLRDITEEKEMERRRLEFEAKIERTQRMEALGTLAGGIAHDLNNTLVPVVALAKMMMNKMPKDSPELAKLRMIYQAGGRSRDLVRQILAFSRNEKPSKSVFQLDLVTREALDMLRATLPSMIQIEYRAEPGLGPILGDVGQLHQVLVNLVTNAAHAIGTRIGRITVCLSSAEAELPEAAGARKRPAVQLAVADTGCGMDEATLKRIFEPFFTTKSVGEGTGLGLAVVHGIVASHGGRIEVRSERGKGTRFDVLLPTVQPAILGHGPTAAVA